MSEGYIDGRNTLIHIDVRIERLLNLTSLDSFLTNEENELLIMLSQYLLEMQKQAIRRLYAQGHGYVQIASYMKMQLVDVLRIGEINL